MDGGLRRSGGPRRGKAFDGARALWCDFAMRHLMIVALMIAAGSATAGGLPDGGTPDGGQTMSRTEFCATVARFRRDYDAGRLFPRSEQEVARNEYLLSMKAECDAEAQGRRLPDPRLEEIEQMRQRWVAAMEDDRRNAARETAAIAKTNDPRSRRIEASASLCRARVVRRQGLDSIAFARRAAKIGGVLDRHGMVEAQYLTAMAERQAQRAAVVLQRLKTKPLPCADPAVAEAGTCDDDPDGCQLDAM